MTGHQIALDSLDGALRDYVSKMFAVRVSSVNAEPGTAQHARATFTQSLLIATHEYNLACGEISAAMVADKGDGNR